MPGWLEPLRQALDGADRPVPFFFRDDDIGWADDRLWPLLDCFDDAGLPLDLAVIPAAIEPQTALRLRERIARSSGRLAAHQHGCTHANYEAQGRRYEFGPSRKARQQLDDLVRGRRLLADALGPRLVVPIFTPPWNRCTPVTGRCVARLGSYKVLSRDVTAAPLGTDLGEVVELPVTVDWFARRKGVRLDREGIGELLGASAAAGGPVGVMFHHEITSDADLAAVADLLEVVAGHPAAAPAPMLEVAGVG